MGSCCLIVKMARRARLQGFLVILLANVAFCQFVTESESGRKNASYLESSRRAEEFIWSQRDKASDFWPRYEATSAIMGVGIRKANLKSGLLASLAANESEIVLQNMERVHTSFLMELIRSINPKIRKEENPKNAFEELENMKEQFILTLVGALKLTCTQDPRNYFGYNLLDILFQRLLDQFKDIKTQIQTKAPPLSYPSIVLALCVNDDTRVLLNDEQDRLALLIPLFPHTLENGKFQPLGIERAAMNVIAATCVIEQMSDLHAEKRALITAAWENLDYIYSLQEDDGGYRTVHSTAMAISAELNRFSSPPRGTERGYLPPMDFYKARDWLVSAQNPDGSFGSSVTLSSLAIAALRNKATKHLKHLNCQNIWKKPTEEFEITISIEDTFYSKQTFYDRIPVKRNDSLHEVLKAYADANPKSLKLVTEKVLGHVLIESINDLANHGPLHLKWSVYKIPNDDLLVDYDKIVELRGLNVPVEESFTFKFIYQ